MVFVIQSLNIHCKTKEKRNKRCKSFLKTISERLTIQVQERRRHPMLEFILAVHADEGEDTNPSPRL